MTRIRPLTDADIDAVAAVHVRSWQIGYAGIVPQDYLDALDPAAFARRRRERLATPGVHTLVAEEDGRVIGFATFGEERDEPGAGELWAIYVTPEHWGRGAGRELLAAAKKELAADGYPVMRLWVFEENTSARRFYEKMGLAPDGTKHTYTPRGTTVELPELRYATPL